MCCDAAADDDDDDDDGGDDDDHHHHHDHDDMIMRMVDRVIIFFSVFIVPDKLQVGFTWKLTLNVYGSLEYAPNKGSGTPY